MKDWQKFISFLVITVIACGLLSIYYLKTGKTQFRNQENPQSPQVDYKSINESFQQMQDAGLFQIGQFCNEAFVETAAWEQATYQEKQTLGYVLAYHCSFQKNGAAAWVEIKDKYTGKKVGKYDGFGFKVY